MCKCTPEITHTEPSLKIVRVGPGGEFGVYTTFEDEDTRILNSFPRHNVLLSSPVRMGGHDGDKQNTLHIWLVLLLIPKIV